MSDASDVILGLVGGGIITVAARAGGLKPLESAAIGGSCGLVLAMSPAARPGGLALAIGSALGALAVAGEERLPRRTRRALAGR